MSYARFNITQGRYLSERANYYCLDNRSIDLGFYEVQLDYSPIRFKPKLETATVEMRGAQSSSNTR